MSYDHAAEAERLLTKLHEGNLRLSRADLQAGALVVIAHTLLAIEEKLS